MEGFFMRTKFWSSIGLLASIAASVGAAGAADLAVKAPVYKAPPPPVILSGYNWQFGQVVIGVEGDADAAFLSKDAIVTDGAGNVGTGKVKTEALESIRGRLGYVVLPQLLAYGTGGVGFGQSKLSDTFGDNASLSQTGWVAGGGLEYKLWGPLIGRVEYLHYGFDSKTVPLVGPVKESVDSVRAGVSYKF
jgi:opacity protein-like surface antigen